VPDEPAGYKLSTSHNWEAAHKRLVVWRIAKLLSWGPLLVADHDYASGTTTRYTLDPGDAFRVLKGR